MQRTRNASTRRLTAKQERFVAAYDGNATAAALAAGYKSTYANRIGVQLLNNPVIAAAIQAREDERNTQSIATREERQMFFTEVMRDSERSTRDRLRACELLGKSEGDFLDRHELTGKDGSALIPEPVIIETHFVDAILNDDGSPINPDAEPERYAAAWLVKFFTDQDKRDQLAQFCEKYAEDHNEAGRGIKLCEIVKGFIETQGP